MRDTQQMSTQASGATKVTIIEEGTELDGSLKSTCAVVVRGRVEGEVSTPTLSVAPTGVVKGKVHVGTMDSAGQLAGEFDADVVRLSGVVSDATVIRAKTLEVKLSSEGKRVVTFGESKLEVGDAPKRPT